MSNLAFIIVDTYAHRARVAITAVGAASGCLEHGRHSKNPAHPPTHTRITDTREN